MNGSNGDETRPGGDLPMSAEQDLSDVDQTRSEADQDSADLDHSGADVDQSASDRDQRASDRDQRASDIDQRWADDRAGRAAADGDTWADTRRTRSQTAIERDISAEARHQSALVRDSVADRRDRDADARDLAAADRDGLAAALDTQMAQLERADLGTDASASSGVLEARVRAARARGRGAGARDSAAAERAEAAVDRRAAAIDREASRTDRSIAGVDGLTGVLRREVGLAAVGRELARVRRSNELLTVAFIDVDGLKAVNDRRGHAAGDELLRDVVRCVTSALRPYDIVLRYGGDEFLCALSGRDVAATRERFTEIRGELTRRHDGATISVGFALAGAEDTAEQLAVRADAAMMGAAPRRARRSAVHPDS